MTRANPFDMDHTELSWCPGCGDYAVLDALKKALLDLGLSPGQVVLVSGIGQAAKMPHYLRSNFFNGLHGRALCAATGIRAANPELTVIAVGGDGDMYGEGGNHFTHTLRRNPDLTVLVCNNMVYGLTKGQASPTSPRGFVTPMQRRGVRAEPFNPLAAALVQGATFVARAFAGNIDHMAGVIGRAILHKGVSLVDIFQPCVTFNKINTYAWFRENTYFLDADRDAGNFDEALRLALSRTPYPLGILYEVEGAETFESGLGAYADDSRPLFMREPDRDAVRAYLEGLL
jgi:2-oxoglutarate ferredoxin oxidoreductase subunit beta